MRKLTLILVAAALAGAPAAAQEANNAATEAPSGIAGPDANMATNATDAATLNGMTGDPALANAPAVPTTTEAPGVTDAMVTPDTGEGGGFPWGLLGLIGLVGLIGRLRS